jgi:hypothetical protein
MNEYTYFAPKFVTARRIVLLSLFGDTVHFMPPILNKLHGRIYSAEPTDICTD